MLKNVEESQMDFYKFNSRFENAFSSGEPSC